VDRKIRPKDTPVRKTTRERGYVEIFNTRLFQGKGGNKNEVS